jgi:hypothetical protein
VRFSGHGDDLLLEQRVLALAERPPRLDLDAVLAGERGDLALLVLTAGTMSVSASSRVRCGTRKLETPIERARPDSRIFSSAFQLST